MFCPVCKSEYREGFTKCSDCGVDLVRQLADDSETKEALWAGQDVSVRRAICDKLDAATILHEDDSVESQFMPAFRQSIYRIQIRKKDHDAALNAIRDIYVDQPNVRQSPGRVLDRNSDWLRTAVAQRDVWGRLTGYDPVSPEPGSESEITADTLASSDADESAEEFPDDQLENFNVCLREVGIGCVVKETRGNFNVCVERASETRAKEIVHEIVEQTPPE